MLFRAERGESMRGWREAAITIAAVLLWLGPAAAKDARPEIAYLVVDAASGTVLAAQNATQPRYSASVPKAMTAYMVRSAERRGGKESVSTFRSGWTPNH